MSAVNRPIDAFRPLLAYTPRGPPFAAGGTRANLRLSARGVSEYWHRRAYARREPPPPGVADRTIDRLAQAYNWDSNSLWGAAPQVENENKNEEGVVGVGVGNVGGDDSAAVHSSSPLHIANLSERTAFERRWVGVAPSEFGIPPQVPRWTQPKGLPHRRIVIRFGVLTIARFIETRLLPMLNTTLLDAPFVDVFLLKTPVSHAAAAYVRARVREFHPNWRGIRVIELYGPLPSHRARSTSYNNAWQNLEILRFWRLEAEAAAVGTTGGEGSGRDEAFFAWNCIIDDDGYVFVDSARAMLWHLQREMGRRARFAADRPNETSASVNIVAAPDGSVRLGKQVWRLRGGAKKKKNLHVTKNRNVTTAPTRVRRTRPPGVTERIFTPPPPHYAGVSGADTEDRMANETMAPMLVGQHFEFHGHPFANGGPGYYFNNEALLLLNTSHISYCLDAFRYWAGDAVAGACFHAAGVAFHGSFGIYNDRFERCFGEMKCHEWGPFPVAFHKLYGGPRALHMAREMYTHRVGRGELVHWADLIGTFNRSEFAMPTTVAPMPVGNSSNVSTSNESSSP